MADLTSRRDHWTDYLPGNVQQSINTNPLLNALGRALSRPAPDLTRGIEYDQHGNVSDRNWLLEQAAGGPPKLNPLAAEMLDKGGLLANFLGPGSRFPAHVRPTVRASVSRLTDADIADISKNWADSYHRAIKGNPNPGVSAWAHRYMTEIPTEFGVRIDRRVMSPGSTPRPSRDFDGRSDFWNGGYLPGTSVYGIGDIGDPTSIAKALGLLRNGGMPGNRISLLAGRKKSLGADPGEWVFDDPIVAQQWRVGEPNGLTW